MTEKKAGNSLAWLTCIHSKKEKEMVRNTVLRSIFVFFFQQTKKMLENTVQLQSMKHEHWFQEEAVALRKEEGRDKIFMTFSPS